MTKEMKLVFGGALCVLILLVGASIAAATEPPSAEEDEVYSLPEVVGIGEVEPVASRAAFEGYVVRSDGEDVAVYDAASGESVALVDIRPAKLREADAAELERGISVADEEALARLIEDLSS